MSSNSQMQDFFKELVYWRALFWTENKEQVYGKVSYNFKLEFELLPGFSLSLHGIVCFLSEESFLGADNSVWPDRWIHEVFFVDAQQIGASYAFDGLIKYRLIRQNKARFINFNRRS